MGRFEYLMAEGSSITEKTRIEAELERTNEELQAFRDRTWAAEALRQSEARFRALAEAIPQIVWTTGPDGLADFLNHRWFEYTGLAPGEDQQCGWLERLHPEDRTLAQRRWEEALRTQGVFEAEYRLRLASGGAYRWHLARAVPVPGPASGEVQWFGTITDVEDLKQAEAAVLEGACWLETTLESVRDALIATDHLGRIRLINPVAQALTGWRAREAVGRPLEEVFRLVDEATLRRRRTPSPGCSARVSSSAWPTTPSWWCATAPSGRSTTAVRRSGATTGRSSASSSPSGT